MGLSKEVMAAACAAVAGLAEALGARSRERCARVVSLMFCESWRSLRGKWPSSKPLLTVSCRAPALERLQDVSMTCQ